MAEFADQESELGRVSALSVVVAPGGANVGDKGEATAFLQSYLAGPLAFRQKPAVLAAAPEHVPGGGNGPHLHRTQACAPVAIETIPGHIPSIPSGQVEAIACVPFHAVGCEHDRGPDRLAPETVASIPRKLVISYEPIPAGDLHAAPLVRLKDAVADD